VSSNEFFAVRIEGRFAHVKTRAVCKTGGATSLVNVAAAQATFDLDEVDGVLVGFWTPDYLTSVAVTGWHLHFLTADSCAGGHLLAISATGLTAQTQPLADFRMALPETPAFLAADLSRDVSSEIATAETDTE
jgi:acetolactate decarboxylase